MENILGCAIIGITVVSMIMCIVAGYYHDKFGDF
jgi:hypothetical protein